MKKVFNKLVRDKIPAIIEADNFTPKTRILDDAEFRTELDRKLEEECAEVLAAENTTERQEELADVYEILRAMSKLEGVTIEDIAKIADQKREKRGGFDEKIYLIESESNE